MVSVFMFSWFSCFHGFHVFHIFHVFFMFFMVFHVFMVFMFFSCFSCFFHVFMFFSCFHGFHGDMNPIENLWMIVKRRIAARKPTSKTKLIEALIDFWHRDPEIRNMCL